ncbi:GNAT family N-acetyltransferase [Sphingomonas sp. Leaf21]|jgi:RimJ/RimL family protein N-acetyltransferase|uniref:GNAT family N-acetyltransferase n=1 Tax=Sphingomonas sp. Leaf21 TaxID=2876550 RepID=UPI001E5C5B6E|nr:GNAT family N-acetyltransferase [Sphingomonas sp. Leaf21]
MSLSLDNRPDLDTTRLSLRRPAEHDVDAIVSIVGDWDVARRLARVPHPYGSRDARFFLERVVPAEWVWAITLRDADRMIGAVGLTPERDAAELGYWLSPAHWGQGIATEAAGAVVDFGFERLGLARLTSGYFEDNPASGRVLAKLGFVETGRVLRPCVAVGGDVPSVRMVLGPQSYSARGGGRAKP